MTEADKKLPPTKAEVKWVGQYLTIQNVIQLVIFIAFVSGFYWKTNYRIDALEDQYRSHAHTIQHHDDWLTDLSVKTGVPPPNRDRIQ